MIKPVKISRTYSGALRREQAQMTRNRILDAARRLLVSGTYSSVTMDDIAKEAGVAYQTVYAIFGTKLRLAQRIMEAGFPHVEEALKLFEPYNNPPTPRSGCARAPGSTASFMNSAQISSASCGSPAIQTCSRAIAKERSNDSWR